MNSGAISTRYAKALLRYSQGTGRVRQVAVQIKAMLDDPEHIPSPLEPDIERFTSLLVEKGRKEYLRPIFRAFIVIYCKEYDIKYAHLTAVADVPGLKEKMQSLLEKQTGCRVVMDMKVDPSIIGGFVLEVGGMMLDASVKHQIEMIRRQFVFSNNRII